MFDPLKHKLMHRNTFMTATHFKAMVGSPSFSICTTCLSYIHSICNESLGLLGIWIAGFYYCTSFPSRECFMGSFRVSYGVSQVIQLDGIRQGVLRQRFLNSYRPRTSYCFFFLNLADHQWPRRCLFWTQISFWTPVKKWLKKTSFN